MEVISRKEALSLGKNHYYTGTPCKHGHMAKRLVSNWTCCECLLIRGRKIPKNRKIVYDKTYRERHKEELRLKKKAYYDETKTIISPEERTSRKERSKLAQTVRHRLHKAIKRKGYKKTSTTAKLIGCSWEELKKHLENQFTEGMTWNNNTYEGWHIDHIIPLSSAKSDVELFRLGHYTNLQPLWAEDNLRKGKRIINK